MSSALSRRLWPRVIQDGGFRCGIQVVAMSDKTDSISAIAFLAFLLTLGLSADGTNDDATEYTPPDTALDAAAAQQARADLGVSGVAF